MMRTIGVILLMSAALILAAAPASAAGDAAKGKQVYLANCAACHGPDPSKDGPLGPSIKGSPKALIEARVMNGNGNYDKSYPAGYKPKRDTRIMVALPHLKGNIDDIAAFLK